MPTERDIQMLATVADLGVATAAQLGRLFFPRSDGRLCRRRIQLLVAAGLQCRTRVEVVNPLGGMTAPVYYCSRKGLEFLAMHFRDSKFLSLPSSRPPWQTLLHRVCIADVHILVNAAAARETAFVIENWCNEWDIVNKDATCPEEKYRLYTLLSQKPRLVAAPDYCFVVRGGGAARLILGEVERATSHPEKVAAEKSRGFAELYRRKLHRRFCADAVDKFIVLMTAPDPRWRDHLVKAFSTKEEPTLYRFAAIGELTPETFFRGPVWKRCDGTVGPLLKAQDEVSGTGPLPVRNPIRNPASQGQNSRAGILDAST